MEIFDWELVIHSVSPLASYYQLLRRKNRNMLQKRSSNPKAQFSNKL